MQKNSNQNIVQYIKQGSNSCNKLEPHIGVSKNLTETRRQIRTSSFLNLCSKELKSIKERN